MHQDRADDQVGVADRLLDVERRGEARVDAGEGLLELAQAVDVAVVDGDVGAHAHRDARRVGADDTAADDHDLRGGHARDAAEQDAAAAGVLVQRVRAGLRGQLARHLAHRGQQRQATTRVGDRLVRDRRRARVDQALR